MLDYDLNKLLFTIRPEDHNKEALTRILNEHPEVMFVSFVGIDIGGHDTDEKIPVEAFIDDMDKMLTKGVQTDGSSVVLPKIANLNNAKVDIIPDLDVNWYVDHNLKHPDYMTGLPMGTLRIPSFLLHNDKNRVGSRVILKNSVVAFKRELMRILRENPYLFDNMDCDSADDIDELILTSATELEFWVKTPDDQSERDRLSTAQELKEQYWKRTIGPVRTALEKTLSFLQRYGFDMEMGHKEVGGVKARLGNSGHYDHIMEQLEIDWKYSTAMQAADNENHIKYVVRDIFRLYGLDVTFIAKPMPGIAGNGEHTHLGVAAKLKDGRHINLFAPEEMTKDFLSPVGFGALMGILKNYDIINPFVSSTNDAFDRLKPGYEAPVCVVTSLGQSSDVPSRNRTVLVGVVREMSSPAATRFELRSPNPNTNTYLTIASSCMAMLDGISAAAKAGKTSKELEASVSKEYGQEDFYLEKDRVYRSEKDVFDEYTPEERDRFFGKAPRTVWENIRVFDEEPEKLEILKVDDVMDDLSLASYKEAATAQWATELKNRIIPNVHQVLRATKKLHDDADCTDYDVQNWLKIDKLRNEMGRNTLSSKCLLTKIKDALIAGDYDRASDLQVEMEAKEEELRQLYAVYKANLF